MSDYAELLERLSYLSSTEARDAHTALTTLLRERDEARRDAERYQEMKHAAMNNDPDGLLDFLIISTPTDQWDAELDAALSSRAGGETEGKS